MEKVEVLLLRPLNPADEVTGNCPIEAFLPLEMGFGETYKEILLWKSNKYLDSLTLPFTDWSSEEEW